MEDLLIRLIMGAVIGIGLYSIFVDFIADIWATRVILKPWPFLVQQRAIRYSYIAAYSTAIILWFVLNAYVGTFFV